MGRGRRCVIVLWFAPSRLVKLSHLRNVLDRLDRSSKEMKDTTQVLKINKSARASLATCFSKKVISHSSRGARREWASQQYINTRRCCPLCSRSLLSKSFLELVP